MATDTHALVEQHADGMPQLDFSTYPNQIFWLVVTLIVIYLVLTRVALPRIASVLAERQGIIANDLAAAEELKAQAVAAEEAYQKALSDAKAEAGRIVAKAKAEIQVELDAAVEKADAEISAKSAESEKRIGEIRENAIRSVKEVADDAAGAVVKAIMPDVYDAKAVTAAVATRMKG